MRLHLRLLNDINHSLKDTAETVSFSIQVDVPKRKRRLYTMEGWTPEHNTYLSCLLDDVTGTEEMVKIRRDYCKILDCTLSSNQSSTNRYFTGSKAEGLDLQGSDEDYMFDINNGFDIEVSESIEDLVQSPRTNKLIIVTDNVPPAFALLKCVSLCDQSLRHSVVNNGDNAYLSSQELLSSSPLMKSKTEKHTRIQGPSFETWQEFEDTSEAGTDHVASILCKDWPTAAAEWKTRPRHYGWPSKRDKESIETFGFHLVPVGHPLSTKRSLEWRVSFSIAERTLVWSFNHTQLQCYALMKLILKEFVKNNCALKHKNVLCSYFIKTFLFWQFETTDPLFWQTSNLTGCLMYLLHEFNICIESGVLRHYFVPRFNLLDIKLTPDARADFLYLFDKVREIGISILGQCTSLSRVLSKFCGTDNVIQSAKRLPEIRRSTELYNDEYRMEFTYRELPDILRKGLNSFPYNAFLAAIDRLSSEGHVRTCFSDVVIRRLCSLISTYKCYHCIKQGNKSMYFYMKNLDNNVYGTDIASCKLWMATFFLQQGDYCSSLQTINDILSAIPPYAIFYSRSIQSSEYSKELYIDMYCKDNSNIIIRAKEAWLTDMILTPQEYPFLPRAIQVDLCYCQKRIGVCISPFTYAFYLMFLCYHELGQYDNRDRALRQLVDIVYDRERCSFWRHHSFNIAGHCMLMAGYEEMAKTLFLESAQFTHSLPSPAFDKYNSAYKYLSLM